MQVYEQRLHGSKIQSPILKSLGIYLFHCTDSVFTKPVIRSYEKWQHLFLLMGGTAYDILMHVTGQVPGYSQNAA